MKRFSLFLVVCASIFLTGCEQAPTFRDTSIEETTIKGVLTEVEEYRRDINGIYGWHRLTFKDGGSVIAHVGPGDILYIGHYQEIKIDHRGMVVSVKCESYERLVSKNNYKEYNPTDELLSVNR